MKGSRGMDVSPRGPLTSMAVGVGVRVTEAGTGMGLLPICDMKPWGRTAEELKQRAALTMCCGRESILRLVLLDS